MAAENETGEKPERFGKFIIRDKIGAGGMAEVFLADAEGPEGVRIRVALKRILPQFANSRDFLTSMISEARVGGSLSHDNIVRTFEFGSVGGRPFLAMEYIDGTTLAELLRYRRHKGTPLPLAITLNIGAQICDALDYAHNAKDTQSRPLHMIHRDLKPSNIMLSRNSNLVKLTDFGIAKAASNVVETATTAGGKGTIPYMSPEQANAEKLDPRSDLYSFGAVLFELLTMARLYPLSGLPGLLRVSRGDVDDRLPLLCAFPPDLVSLVSQLVAREPDLRPESAYQVRRRLIALAATQPSCLFELRDVVLDFLRDEAYHRAEASSSSEVASLEAFGMSQIGEEDLAGAAPEDGTWTIARGEEARTSPRGRGTHEKQRGASDPFVVDGSGLAAGSDAKQGGGAGRGGDRRWAVCLPDRTRQRFRVIEKVAPPVSMCAVPARRSQATCERRRRIPGAIRPWTGRVLLPRNRLAEVEDKMTLRQATAHGTSS